MSSSASSGVSFRRRGAERGRGIPRKCRCGVGSIIRTSETFQNPGRLFYCCPNGSKEDKGHLFKWTDISMVEEMEEVESVVEKIQVTVESLEKGLHDVESDIENLTCETRTCEAVTYSYEKDFEAMKAIGDICEKEIGELKDMVSCCEKEIEELKTVVSCIKNMVVCGLVMVLIFFFIFL